MLKTARLARAGAVVLLLIGVAGHERMAHADDFCWYAGQVSWEDALGKCPSPGPALFGETFCDQGAVICEPVLFGLEDYAIEAGKLKVNRVYCVPAEPEGSSRACRDLSGPLPPAEVADIIAAEPALQERFRSYAPMVRRVCGTGRGLGECEFAAPRVGDIEEALSVKAGLPVPRGVPQ